MKNVDRDEAVGDGLPVGGVHKELVDEIMSLLARLDERKLQIVRHFVEELSD